MIRRRQTHQAGESWRKWEGGLDPRFPVRPWWAFPEGRLGLHMVFICLGALLGVLARHG